MRLVIDILDDADAERAVALLRDQGIAVHVGGDGGPSIEPFDPKKRFDELQEQFREFRGTLPPDYKFDRNEIHDRHG